MTMWAVNPTLRTDCCDGAEIRCCQSRMSHALSGEHRGGAAA